uniref:CHCH domain-containing protein n=1 Tax=Aureoumbra lagunensis TaxID=44058 RepID=A0A7S3K092_9STRA|mmetsp:Transcript_2267/g.3597  ORF Transcript_2267/g.3597 Transcript_2267/m.3597 type:complete len:153 (+) Transcript_2267:96-554(+)
MPRSGGRRSAPARSAPRQAPRQVVRTPPPPARQPPPPQPTPQHQSPPPAMAPRQQSGGMMSGLMGTMAQGMAFGAGSSVAHHAVGAAMNSMFGGRKPEEVTPQVVEKTPVASACEQDKSALYQCITSNDAEKCADYFQALQSCQENAKFATN